jgi:hypothetical protein
MACSPKTNPATMRVRRPQEVHVIWVVAARNPTSGATESPIALSMRERRPCRASTRFAVEVDLLDVEVQNGASRPDLPDLRSYVIREDCALFEALREDLELLLTQLSRAILGHGVPP